MIERLIQNIIKLFVVIFFIGCCNTPDKENNLVYNVKPLWSQKLTIGKSLQIWNKGLGTPMLYNDFVIFNTTITFNNTIEDHRLCGLDISTGEIKWMFPSDDSHDYNYYFDGESYIYNNNLLVKSPSVGNRTENEILNINLNNITLNKSTKLLQSDWDKDCFGYSKYAVWVDNFASKAQISKMDIETGVVENIISNDNANIDFDVVFSIIGIYNDELIYIEQEFNSNTHGRYVCVYDIENNELIYRHKVAINNNNYSLTGTSIDNNVVYLTIGPSILAVNYRNGKIIWQTDINEVPNYYISKTLVCGDNLFVGGGNMYMVMNKDTGEIIYKRKDIGSQWAVEHSGYVYANISEQILIINPATGEILDRIICPEEKVNGDGFNISNVASFHNDCLYVMSYTTAYCYPIYPWD